MKKKNKPFIRLLQVALWPLILGLILLWYRGFYKPDPYVMALYAPFSTGLLWSLRIGVPLIIAYIVGLIWGYKTRRMSVANTITLMGSLLLCAILGLIIMNYTYKKSVGQFSDFHPYLQLNPVQPPDLNTGEYNLLCLGGSTTEFKDSNGKGWPERVETLINKKCHRNDIQLFNLGKQWYTTQHSLIYYETSLRRSQPDAIIIMHTINDLLHNADFSYFSCKTFQPDYSHFYGPVYRLVHPQGFLSFLGWMTQSMWYYLPRDTIHTTEFPGLVSFTQNLNSIIDLAERDGVPVILMTQPNLYKEQLSEEELDALYMLRFEAIGPDKQWAASTVHEGFKQYHRALQSIAEKRRIPLIDLEHVIPKDLQYFKDDVHYRDPAFDLVAEVVADQLIKQLTFKK